MKKKFKMDSKTNFDHIGDAELSELSIAHGFGAIWARTKTLRPPNHFLNFRSHGAVMRHLECGGRGMGGGGMGIKNGDIPKFIRQLLVSYLNLILTQYELHPSIIVVRAPICFHNAGSDLLTHARWARATGS